MGAKDLKILIIDDKQDDLVALSNVLKDVFPEARTLTALEGKIGIEAARAENPDVILLNIVMTGMDGFEICRRIKADKRLKEIPVIFLTSHETRKDTRLKALETGAEGFLAKPIDETELAAQVRAMVKIKAGNTLKQLEKARLAAMVLEPTLETTQRRLVEEALRQSEQKYRTLAENITDSIYMIDKNGKILSVNASAAKLLHKNPEEVIGKTVFDLFPKELAEIYSENLKRVFVSGADYVTESDLIIDEKRIWISTSLSPVRNPANEVIATIGVTRDVTQRKKAEEELHALFQHQETILSAIPDIVMEVNNDKIYTWANHAGIDFFGEDVIGKEASYYFEGEQGTYRSVQPVFNGSEQTIYLESYQRRKDGEKRLLAWWCRSLKDTHGNVVGALSAAQDITERKQGELHLLESQKKFQALVETTSDFIWEMNLNGVYTYCSPQMEKLWGLKPEEMLGKTPFDLLPPQDREQAIKAFSALSESSSPFMNMEMRSFDSTGQIIFLEISGVPFFDIPGKPSGYRGITRDITGRKREEEILRESEERYRTLFESAAEGILINDAETKRFKYANPAICTMLGYRQEELTKMSVDDIHPKATLEHVFAEITQVIEGKALSSVLPCLKKDGTILYVNINGTKAIINGRDCIIGFFTDITERLQAEQSLRLSEERFRLIAETSPDYIIQTDKVGNIIYASPACKALVGYAPEELINHNYSEFVPAASLSATQTLMTGALKGIIMRNVETEILHKNGRAIAVEASIASHIINGEVISLYAIIRDITDRKKTEEDRQRIAKLESVGILAGGIAHDFNNLLTGIMGNIQLAKICLNDKQVNKLPEMLREAEIASLRARDLTQQLLTFSRGGAPVKKTVAINTLIKESCSLAVRGSQVKCEFSLADDLYLVEADEGQVSQVITNMVINADQAMPEGGTIQITACNLVLGEGNTLLLPEGKYVRVSVQDQGIGIPEKYLIRIFEPYFTTKEKGHGLGLATAYSIIKNHGGKMTVESKVEFGTTFHIYLPGSTQVAPLETSEIAKGAVIRGKGKILVMDDEEVIRKLLTRMLTGSGYQIELGKDGAEAVELYRKAKECGQPFAAVIMDLTIPGGMGGKEAIQKVLEIDPAAKVIVSSGYSTDPIMADYKKYGFSGVVAKPYNIREVEQTLHNLLEVKN